MQKPIPAKTDIFIIGAGPAGATLSLFLAKKQIAHVIVDAAKFPRDKICGDGLDLKVIRVLKQLDPKIVEEEIPNHPHFQRIGGVRGISPDGNETLYGTKDDTPNQHRPMFWTCKRIHFDDFLVKKFNATFANFHEETKVTSLIKVADGWQITTKRGENTTQTHANLVVGADGDHSILLRALGERGIDRRNYASAVRMYYKNVLGPHQDAAKPIEVYFPPSMPMGYFWMFPLPNNELNTGFGMVAEIISAQKVNLREKMLELIATDPYLAPKFKHAEPLEKPIGYGLPLATRQRKTFGENWLLIGDSASMINPASGEGIGTAMISGLIAAEFLEKAVVAQRFDEAFFKNFDREIYRRLKGEIWGYNFMMKLKPVKLWNIGINMVMHTPVMKLYFKLFYPKWVRTGFEKPMEVEV